MTSSKEESVKRLQSAVRGYAVRKHQITPLKRSEQTEYKPFLIGNDKPLSSTDIAAHQLNMPFILVGTSMFRAVDFACRLAGNEITPKVIIVDNSIEVFHAWQKLRTFFTETHLTSTDDYLEGNEGILEFIVENLSDTIQCANVFKYFKDFFDTFSFEHVRKIVMGMTVICQDWSNEDTFTQIKEIYHDIPIVAYPSNIVSHIEEPEIQIKILKCIEILEPVLCIYTNFDSFTRTPSKTYVMPNFSSYEMAKTLNLNNKVLDKLDDKPNQMLLT